MITSAKVIYEGEGILRLVAPAPDLPLHQELYADILVPEPEFEWDVPYNPSAEAVWGAMGTFGIQDQALAEWLAFSPEIAEQNQFLYELTESATTDTEPSREIEANPSSDATIDKPSI
ncbi:MAG: hypothetical protein EYC68_19645 [Chloroflexota bacterium]|nr:MAG: hypothetical protein EYC68_19645 [Chloroflexota bacterium]